MGVLKKIKSHLFLKITVLFLGVLLLASLVLPLAHHHFFNPNRFPIMQKNVVHHAQYLIEQLGTPPDQAKIKHLNTTLGIQFRIEGQGNIWTVPEGVVEFDQMDLVPVTGQPGISMDTTRQFGLCITIEKGDFHYLMVMRPKHEVVKYVGLLFVLTISVFAFLIIIAMYLGLRWLLKPIKTLEKGISQLGEGHLDHQMKTEREDELGQLVDSFNTMTGRIRNMIQARDQLVLDVSHELRSPLTRMRVAAEFIQDEKTQQSIVEDIDELELKITELLETERLNSQHGQLNREPTNLKSLIQEIADLLGQTPPGIKILNLPADISLNLDKNRFQILIRNILENALKYTPEAGKPVEISAQKQDSKILLTIQDYGKGIPQEDLPYIFEPFYRVDKSRSQKTGGYGLGMSLCKTIVEAHGGTIEIESRVDQGTLIRISI